MSQEPVNAEFVTEALEIIDKLNRDLIAVETARRAGKIDPELVNNLFRYAHTLKGTAAMYSLQNMTGLAHAMESVLDGMRLGRVDLSPEGLDLMFACVERFASLTARASMQEPDQDVDDLLWRLAALAKGTPVAGPLRTTDTPPPIPEMPLDPAVFGVLTEYEEHRLRENLKQGCQLYLLQTIFEISNFDVGLAELDAVIKGHGEIITKLPSANMKDPDHIGFEILVGTTLTGEDLRSKVGDERIQLVLLDVGQTTFAAYVPGAAVEPPAASAKAATAAGPPDSVLAEPQEHALLPPPSKEDHREAEAALASLKSVSQTVRVDIRRLDLLMNLVGELSLTKLAVQRISETLRREQGFVGMAVELHKESRAFERRLAELQAGIMEVRMVPLSSLFERMVRAGRKMARELGRELHIDVVGENTELDKLIVEDLADPLMHLIRNAIDHGIEIPEQRRKHGKAPEGVVHLSAAARGNHVLVQVSDDGNGIDYEKVLATAIKRGQTTPERAKELSRRDIFNFLFAPGFSTRTEVSEYSGRGVGLDVVKTNIGRLSGVIEVDSVPGQGSTFTVTLPMTLAILPALIVQVAGFSFAVPVNNVLETVGVSMGDIETIEGREVLSLRGATVPVFDLREAFRLSNDGRPANNFAVVTGAGQTRLALLVDDLTGQRDIVIKSLGTRLSNVRGIAGATELGNQQTILVIDTMGLMNQADSQSDKLMEAS